jgi:hypothetical protein
VELRNNSKHKRNRSNKCKKEKQQAQKGEITSVKKGVVANMTRRNIKHKEGNISKV